MSKMIFGLVGGLAGGKGTVAQYLQENHNATSFAFSDVLRETLSSYDLEISRDNLQGLSTVMREKFGENILAKAMAKRVRDAESKIVVVDGVRRFTDIENLTPISGFHLIHIDANQKIRYERQIKRNQNAGDNELTLEEFAKKEQAEADRQIPEVAKQAEFEINNNGTMEELYKQLEEIIFKCK